MQQVLDIETDRHLDLRDRTSDELEIRETAIENLIGDLRSEQARILSEIEARHIPQEDGSRSLHEWAKARLDVSDDTASDLIRLAHTDDDPGEGSVDRRVVTVRFAEAGASARQLELSLGFDIRGVERLIAHRKRHARTDSRKAFQSRYLCLQPSLDESIWRVHGRLAGVDGKLVEDVLTEKADSLPSEPGGIAYSGGARKADALVAICQDQATSNFSDSGGGVTIFVDAAQAAATNGEAGVFVEAGPRVGVDAIEEILCTGTTEVIARGEDGTPMTYGRKTRVVPPSLRKTILQRDGHACTIAGCSSRYRLQVHHILPYSEDGRTDPDNLTTVCWYHRHVAIHGMGMKLDPNSPPQRQRLLRSHSGRGPP